MAAQERPILLVAYGGGHVAMLAPVATLLISQNRPFIFLALTTAGPALESLGIPYIGFKDLPQACDSDVQMYGRMLVSDIPQGSQVSLEESIAYLGSNFSDLVQVHGESNAWNLYKMKGRQAFLPVRSMKRTLRFLNPSLVLSTNSPRTEKASILAAKQLDIPSVCVIDMFALNEVQWIGEPGFADRLCVINQDVREMFFSCGRDENEVLVTGNPAFDTLKLPTTAARGQDLRKSRGWDDNKTTILWASQVEPARHPFTGSSGDPMLPNRIEEVLRKFVFESDQYRLVVRYHPSEITQFRPAKDIYLSPADEPLDALLHAVDIVVVMSSTVGLEASIVGRPVISVDRSVCTADTPFSRMGISTGVGHESELPQALASIECSRIQQQDRDQLKSTHSAATQVLQVVNSLLY